MFNGLTVLLTIVERKKRDKRFLTLLSEKRA